MRCSLFLYLFNLEDKTGSVANTVPLIQLLVIIINQLKIKMANYP
jgi:hypothetical protein